jgi:cytochrome c-type biogenesis protein CcmH/NrfF
MHDWKTCRCTDCQAIHHAIEDARSEGATDMRNRILKLAEQFKVPAMAITFLKGLPLPERKWK